MNKKNLDHPLFSFGFRVFFALAGLFALVLIALWTSIFKGAIEIDNYYPNDYWHGHEMLLGYSVAVIAGFLLTAVKSWTGINCIKDEKLLGLCLLWVYGRLVPYYSELLPDFLIALVDLLFIPVLAYYVAKPLIKTHDYIKLLFVAILLLLGVGNLLIHAEILGFYNNSAVIGLELVIAIIIMMIIVIAGQLFPTVTERGLKGVMTIRNPLMDLIAIASSTLVFVLLVLDISGFWLFLVSVSAFASNALRAIGWYEQRVRYVPLLWVLYMGYLWIMIGFILVALAALSWVSQTIAIHAFTIGGIGVLTLGMMARVSLGETGRALKSSNTLALAFALINIAALLSALMPALLPSWYSNLLLISSYCWLSAFSLFAFIYSPILLTNKI